MNIVLIGMPGCGKSTVGVLLAKSMLFNFMDTDLIIQGEYAMPLSEIIGKRGTNAFKEIENDILKELRVKSTVIATGGSAVYGKEAMNNLKNGGTIVYLKLPLEEIESRIKNIKTRGIVMDKGKTLNDIYIERTPLYEKYADITVDCSSLTAEECVDKIVEELKKPR